ncbi:DUF4376 domain-containing protein [Paenibacillus oleatilyticus]|uniref:DUF4376 domain-containing protein n=1 Tax=Paenibacillus oleatilyticus TaxID=2594886 RepID=UPI001C1F947A|nr:hypothetical protein [Paenibacillus oleatilyticus]MBU7316234.1 hypothetical protein [Paenibacillus oleatilyticus]
MKEAIIVDQLGIYKEPTLVADDETGVSSIITYKDSEGGKQTAIVQGHIVAVPVPEGLHLPKWDFTQEQWIEGKPADELLILQKASKLAELKRLCTEAIEGTFTSSALGEEHVYSFDMEAQLNFQSTKELMNMHPNFTQTSWKTRDAGVLMHTKEQFTRLWLDGQMHKTNLIEKFRRLEKELEHATSVDAVNSIRW